MDIAKYNRKAWDGLVQSGNRWTVPVSSEEIAEARNGNWNIVLTPRKPVPREWFGELSEKNVLCLASGGGQQGPILAAAGANVTVYDNSPAQLQQDQRVADRDSLDIKTIQGDMRDLSEISDATFDLVFHPCSNGFVPDINPVWREGFRVLKPTGIMMAGFINPVFYLFDYYEMEKGNLTVKYSIPYSDRDQLDKKTLEELIAKGEPLEYGHTLADQIGGQLRAGFELVGLYEDEWDDPPVNLLSKYIQPFIATLCRKPG